MQQYQGQLRATPGRIAIVAARFNELVVKELIAGAVDTLQRHGFAEQQLCLVRVPGAYEVPLACKWLAGSGRYAGLIALGCVIRGETPHFDFVAQAANSGLMQVSLESGLPIGFGVLTVENLEQALARAGSKAGNKGSDAALALLEQMSLALQIKELAS